MKKEEDGRGRPRQTNGDMIRKRRGASIIELVFLKRQINTLMYLSANIKNLRSYLVLNALPFFFVFPFGG